MAPARIGDRHVSAAPAGLELDWAGTVNPGLTPPGYLRPPRLERRISKHHLR